MKDRYMPRDSFPEITEVQAGDVLEIASDGCLIQEIVVAEVHRDAYGGRLGFDERLSEEIRPGCQIRIKREPTA